MVNECEKCGERHPEKECPPEDTTGNKSAFSAGLDKREIIGNALAKLWPHLKRATQHDIINRMREQPKAMLDPIQLQPKNKLLEKEWVGKVRGKVEI